MSKINSITQLAPISSCFYLPHSLVNSFMLEAIKPRPQSRVYNLDLHQRSLFWACASARCGRWHAGHHNSPVNLLGKKQLCLYQTEDTSGGFFPHQ